MYHAPALMAHAASPRVGVGDLLPHTHPCSHMIAHGKPCTPLLHAHERTRYACPPPPPPLSAPVRQVDGASHVVHVEEEAAGTRLIINTLTCLLAKEADPSQLLSTSPGKLVRHLVASGA